MSAPAAAPSLARLQHDCSRHAVICELKHGLRTGQFGQKWAALGGTVGLASFMREQSLLDLDWLCRRLGKLHKTSASKAERQERLSELLVLLCPLDPRQPTESPGPDTASFERDPRPVRHLYRHLVGACTIEVSQQWYPEAGWEAKTRKRTPVTHPGEAGLKRSLAVEALQPAMEKLSCSGVTNEEAEFPLPSLSFSGTGEPRIPTEWNPNPAWLLEMDTVEEGLPPSPRLPRSFWDRWEWSLELKVVMALYINDRYGSDQSLLSQPFTRGTAVIVPALYLSQGFLASLSNLNYEWLERYLEGDTPPAELLARLADSVLTRLLSGQNTSPVSVELTVTLIDLVSMSTQPRLAVPLVRRFVCKGHGYSKHHPRVFNARLLSRLKPRDASELANALNSSI